METLLISLSEIVIMIATFYLSLIEMFCMFACYNRLLKTLRNAHYRIYFFETSLSQQAHNSKSVKMLKENKVLPWKLLYVWEKEGKK